MPSDQTVSAAAILAAVMEIQRTGTTPVLERLEQIEPELANHLMESLSAVYHKMLALNGPPKKTQRAYREIETLALVCITALQKSHFELWRKIDEDGAQPPPPQ